MSLDQLFEDLVRRIRNGDDSAAEELVRTYEPVVRREIRLRMTDRNLGRMLDSVDICQSVWSSFFIRVSAGQFDLESPQQLTQLLVAMAKNKLAFQSRKHRYQKRDVRRVDPNAAAIEMIYAEQPSPSEFASAKELFVRMRQCLSDEESQISELRRSGLTWDGVAEKIGGTAQARRMQLDRAADRVTRQLGLDQ